MKMVKKKEKVVHVGLIILIVTISFVFVSAEFVSSTSSAVRDLPSDYDPGVSFVVTITINPTAGVDFYLVEERPPIGWVASQVDNSGSVTFDGRIRWVFLDNLARTLRYTITPPLNAQGIQTFSGDYTYNADALTEPIGGESSISTGQFPYLSFIGNKNANEKQFLGFVVNASDEDTPAVLNQLLIFNANPLPSGAKFVPLGDVDLDGQLDGGDSLLINQYIVGLKKSEDLTPAQKFVADFNRDGVITGADSLLINQILNGLRTYASSPQHFNRYAFVWTPAGGSAGSYPLTFSVSDGALSDTEDITITVNSTSFFKKLMRSIGLVIKGWND